ncbi:MAG: hypothetical protein NZM09_01620 [Ignavibacterium sp.]|nr:hypothetical protein [Ignavibacterium sp.]MCX7611099.1 hypothetical protein [Ignavibacterium sp.]MDW8374372.1 hypothetical protein [Ignavibacteriales bacterium]
MKKLFNNYNFEFDKNEKKLLKAYCSQILKQISGNPKFYSEERVFNSIIQKLDSSDTTIKLTRDEKTKLSNQLRQNVENLSKEMKKGWFIRRWIYKSLYKQYNILLEKHFKS